MRATCTFAHLAPPSKNRHGACTLTLRCTYSDSTFISHNANTNCPLRGWAPGEKG